MSAQKKGNDAQVGRSQSIDQNGDLPPMPNKVPSGGRLLPGKWAVPACFASCLRDRATADPHTAAGQLVDVPQVLCEV